MVKKELDFDCLHNEISTTLAAWNRPGEPPAPTLSQLHLVRQSLSATETDSEIIRMVIHKVLLNVIEEKLHQLDEKQAQAIIYRHVQNETANGTQLKLGMSSRFQVNRVRKEGIINLTKLLIQEERHVQQKAVVQLKAALGEPSYRTLFGVEEAYELLWEALNDESETRPLIITGMGGIGKTALVHNVLSEYVTTMACHKVVNLYVETGEWTTRQLLNRLAGALHLPAGQQPSNELEFSISQQLATLPHLIWLDNFESDVSHLLPLLNRLAEKSRLILTAREQPKSEGQFYHQALSPLSKTDTLALIRHVAAGAKIAGKKQGVSELVTASDAQLTPIYDLVGGNPLACKLIVGLTRSNTVKEILADLQSSAKLHDVEQLYRRIYWRVWRSLQPIEKQVFQAMALVSGTSGASAVTIQAFVPNLELSQVKNALAVLIQRSLVEKVSGSVWDEALNYTVHALSRAFLNTQLIGLDVEVI